MNCSVTLSPEEFKILHNSLCDLNQLAYYHHVPKVEEIVERIRKVALKSAYEQDNRAFETKHDYYREYQILHNFRSVWSIYELEAPRGFDQVDPYRDSKYVVYDEHWGEGGEVVREIKGPTWGDLYRAADEAIQASGDTHHCFIESFTPIEDKPGHLRLNTGS